MAKAVLKYLHISGKALLASNGRCNLTGHNEEWFVMTGWILCPVRLVPELGEAELFLATIGKPIFYQVSWIYFLAVFLRIRQYVSMAKNCILIFGEGPDLGMPDIQICTSIIVMETRSLCFRISTRQISKASFGGSALLELLVFKSLLYCRVRSCGPNNAGRQAKANPCSLPPKRMGEDVSCSFSVLTILDPLELTPGNAFQVPDCVWAQPAVGVECQTQISRGVESSSLFRCQVSKCKVCF